MAKMSAAARALMYGPPPPAPEPRPMQATYTITNCGIGWRVSRCCSGCRHCVASDALGVPFEDPECWHPSVKRVEPYPHGPVISEKHEAEDGCCDKFEDRA